MPWGTKIRHSGVVCRNFNSLVINDWVQNGQNNNGKTKRTKTEMAKTKMVKAKMVNTKMAKTWMVKTKMDKSKMAKTKIAKTNNGNTQLNEAYFHCKYKVETRPKTFGWTPTYYRTKMFIGIIWPNDQKIISFDWITYIYFIFNRSVSSAKKPAWIKSLILQW